MPREFLYVTSTGEVRGDSTIGAFSSNTPEGYSVVIDPVVTPGAVFRETADSAGNRVAGVIFDGAVIRAALPPELDSFHQARVDIAFAQAKQTLKSRVQQRESGYFARLILIVCTRMLNEVIGGRTTPFTKSEVVGMVDTVIDGGFAD